MCLCVCYLYYYDFLRHLFVFSFSKHVHTFIESRFFVYVELLLSFYINNNNSINNCLFLFLRHFLPVFLCLSFNSFDYSFFSLSTLFQFEKMFSFSTTQLIIYMQSLTVLFIHSHSRYHL